MEIRDLPGVELLLRGLEDLRKGVESEEAFLVAIGAPRLLSVGVPVPTNRPAAPEEALYALLAKEHSRDAHSRYLSLVRRLESLERALELRHFRARRLGEPVPSWNGGDG